MAAAIVISPLHGIVSSIIQVNGSGYTPGDAMSFIFNGSPITPVQSPVNVGLDGTFVAYLTVPSSSPGTYAVAATDAHSLTNSQNFTVDTTQSFGNLLKAFNAQAVRVQLWGQEAILVTNVSRTKDHPKSTIFTRAGTTYFWASAIITVTFDALVTKDLYDALAALNTRDSRGALPLGTFSVFGQNLDGSGSDDITATFQAFLPTLLDQAADQGQYLVRVTLAIKNTTYVPG